MQVNKAGQGPVLIPAELQKPEAGLGEILFMFMPLVSLPQNYFGIPRHTRNQEQRACARCQGTNFQAWLRPSGMMWITLLSVRKFMG